MPKLKVKSGAKKRFKVTAGGIKRRRAFRNHILTKKKTKLKRHFGLGKLLAELAEEFAEDLGRSNEWMIMQFCRIQTTCKHLSKPN